MIQTWQESDRARRHRNRLMFVGLVIGFIAGLAIICGNDHVTAWFILIGLIVGGFLLLYQAVKIGDEQRRRQEGR